MRTASRMLKSEIPPPFSRIFRCKAGSVVLVRSSTGSGLIFPLLQNAISVPPAVLRIPSSTVTTQLSGWVNDQSPQDGLVVRIGAGHEDPPVFRGVQRQEIPLVLEQDHTFAGRLERRPAAIGRGIPVCCRIRIAVFKQPQAELHFQDAPHASSMRLTGIFPSLTSCLTGTAN